MAVQFGTAWSSIIKGVGVISGGAFYCAQSSSVTATGTCMKGPPPSLRVSIEMADRKAQAGEIDPTDNLRGQQIYLFHGYNDDTVTRPVTDAAAEFYEHYLGQGGSGQLFYQKTLGAGHAFIVTDTPRTVNLNDCSSAGPRLLTVAVMTKLVLSCNTSMVPQRASQSRCFRDRQELRPDALRRADTPAP
jgi:hypothetical protein